MRYWFPPDVPVCLNIHLSRHANLELWANTTRPLGWYQQLPFVDKQQRLRSAVFRSETWLWAGHISSLTVMNGRRVSDVAHWVRTDVRQLFHLERDTSTSISPIPTPAHRVPYLRTPHCYSRGVCSRSTVYCIWRATHAGGCCYATVTHNQCGLGVIF